MTSLMRLIASTAAAAALLGTGAPIAGGLHPSTVARGALSAVEGQASVAFAQQAPDAARTALRGATVIDVVAGTTVPDAVIVIEADKITISTSA